MLNASITQFSSIILFLLSFQVFSEVNGNSELGFEYFKDTLFEKNCTVCHSGYSPNGELALETYEDFLQIVTPGSPASSDLIDRLTTKNPDRKMPPWDNWNIEEEELQKLKIWIQSGAIEMGANPSKLGPANYKNVKEKIFQNKCVSCHGESYFSEENLKAFLKSEGRKAFFLNLLRTGDTQLRMPLGEKALNREELKLIESWLMLLP